MYSKVARFNAVQYDHNGKANVTVNAGSGFFYTFNGDAYFVTDRRYVIIEEKAFLPDSIIIHQNNIEWQTRHAASIEGMEISLYDKNEKPVWQVLSHSEQDDKRMLISVHIPQDMAHERQIISPEASFLATEQLPKEVFLAMDDNMQKIKNGKETSLSIPVSIGLSLADYFLYSDKSNEKELQKKIEKQYLHSYQNYRYDDIDEIIDVNFKIHRKSFAKDMIEMVLVLLDQNMDKIKEISYTQNLQHRDESNQELEKIREKSKKFSELSHIHSNLIKELEKITEQFQDVLEPSIFDRIDTIFKIMMTKQNSLAGLSLLVRNESDYVIVKHLIHKILEQLGKNIVFVQ